MMTPSVTVPPTVERSTQPKRSLATSDVSLRKKEGGNELPGPLETEARQPHGLALLSLPLLLLRGQSPFFPDPPRERRVPLEKIVTHVAEGIEELYDLLENPGKIIDENCKVLVRLSDGPLLA